MASRIKVGATPNRYNCFISGSPLIRSFIAGAFPLVACKINPSEPCAVKILWKLHRKIGHGVIHRIQGVDQYLALDGNSLDKFKWPGV
jgi:hypothetical protein